MQKSDIDPHIPHANLLLSDCPEILANGGSCIAGPDGEWMIEPVTDKETLLVTTLNHELVIKERHNFDPAGHYARPDVTKLTIDKRRQQIIDLIE
jgi:nitrilase